MIATPVSPAPLVHQLTRRAGLNPLAAIETFTQYVTEHYTEEGWRLFIIERYASFLLEEPSLDSFGSFMNWGGFYAHDLYGAVHLETLRVYTYTPLIIPAPIPPDIVSPSQIVVDRQAIARFPGYLLNKACGERSQHPLLGVPVCALDSSGLFRIFMRYDLLEILAPRAEDMAARCKRFIRAMFEDQKALGELAH